jgi:hypothetical protein
VADASKGASRISAGASRTAAAACAFKKTFHLLLMGLRPMGLTAVLHVFLLGLPGLHVLLTAVLHVFLLAVLCPEA